MWWAGQESEIQRGDLLTESKGADSQGDDHNADSPMMFEGPLALIRGLRALCSRDTPVRDRPLGCAVISLGHVCEGCVGLSSELCSTVVQRTYTSHPAPTHQTLHYSQTATDCGWMARRGLFNAMWCSDQNGELCR
jgi:hypothetical protein